MSWAFCQHLKELEDICTVIFVCIFRNVFIVSFRIFLSIRKILIITEFGTVFLEQSGLCFIILHVLVCSFIIHGYADMNFPWSSVSSSWFSGQIPTIKPFLPNSLDGISQYSYTRTSGNGRALPDCWLLAHL